MGLQANRQTADRSPAVPHPLPPSPAIAQSARPVSPRGRSDVIGHAAAVAAAWPAPSPAGVHGATAAAKPQPTAPSLSGAAHRNGEPDGSLALHGGTRAGRPSASASQAVTTVPHSQTYHTLDGHTIELPPGMTAAAAARLEAEGAAAAQHLGRRSPPQPTAAVLPHAAGPGAGSESGRPDAERREPGRSAAQGGAAQGGAVQGGAAQGRAERDGAAEAVGQDAGPQAAAMTAPRMPVAGPVGQYLLARGHPVLAAGIGKLHSLSHHEQTHASAAEKVRQAEDAVVVPPGEGQSASNSAQVAVVAGRPAPMVDAGRGTRELEAALAQNMPRTVEDVDNFKQDQRAQHVGAAVLEVIAADKNAVVATFADMEHTPAPAPPEHAALSLPPEELAPPTPAMNLGHAAVAPLLAEHTDLSHYPREADARLREEGITQEQLNMVDSGDLAAANREKRGLEQTASSAPQAARQFALAEAAQVEQGLQQQEKTERDALTAHRHHGLGVARQQQTSTKSALEQRRAAAAAFINGKFKAVQDHVTQRLADLENRAMQQFDAGNALAARTFEDTVNRELDAYKLDRYSGWFGGARKAKDWLLGLDGLHGVKDIFERNRRIFVGTIGGLIGVITADSRRVIQECRDALTQTRNEIRTYVDHLAPALRDIANKTANEVSTKLGELDGFIGQKEQALQQKLADRQQAAIQAIDDRIEKMKTAMSGALARLGALLLWAAKKFFTWALQKFGYSLGDIEAIISKGAAVLKAIFTHPIEFVKHLIAAARLGMQNFGGNFLTHLKNAVFDWLTGSLEGISLPSSWDLKGIASVALQILGITWGHIRGKVVRLVGEPALRSMETGFDLVVSLVRDGPIAAWEKLQEMGEEIKKAFVAGVEDFIKVKIVEQAIKTIVSLFVPGAGIIRAIVGIYDTIVFFVQKARQIAEMIGSFLSSIGEIAAGNVAGAAAALENGLARGLMLVINFLARFLRLDGVTAKIRQAIQRLHDRVDKMLDRVAEWIAGKARAAGRLAAGHGPAAAGHGAAPARHDGVPPAGYGAAPAGHHAVPTAVGHDATPAAAAASASDNVREMARRRITQELHSDHSAEEAQAIVARIGRELRPAGLRSLEISPRDEEGQALILAEASARQPMLKLLPRGLIPRGTTVRMVGQVVTAAPMVQDESHLAAADPSARYRRSRLLGAPAKPLGGVLWNQQQQQVDVVTWNTGSLRATGNASHAEHQFIHYLRQKQDASLKAREADIRRKEADNRREDTAFRRQQAASETPQATPERGKVVSDIPEFFATIRGLTLGINLSSCTVCADELKGLLEDIKATGAPVTASLAWEKLYIGGVGFRQATTAQSLSELGGAGWQLTGPRELSPSTSAGGGAVHVEPLESR